MAGIFYAKGGAAKGFAGAVAKVGRDFTSRKGLAKR